MRRPDRPACAARAAWREPSRPPGVRAARVRTPGLRAAGSPCRRPLCVPCEVHIARRTRCPGTYPRSAGMRACGHAGMRGAGRAGQPCMRRTFVLPRAVGVPSSMCASAAGRSCRATSGPPGVRRTGAAWRAACTLLGYAPSVCGSGGWRCRPPLGAPFDVHIARRMQRRACGAPGVHAAARWVCCPRRLPVLPPVGAVRAARRAGRSVRGASGVRAVRGHRPYVPSEVVRRSRRLTSAPPGVRVVRRLRRPAGTLLGGWAASRLRRSAYTPSEARVVWRPCRRPPCMPLVCAGRWPVGGRRVGRSGSPVGGAG